MKNIIAIDIGGTTFKTGLFNESLKLIDISEKNKIRYYNDKEEIISAIIKQVKQIISKNNLSYSNILGLGIASPGPLDSKKGIILNTPNLKIFKNYNIVSDFKKRLKIKTYLENDANLYSLGEWHTHYRKNNIVIGVTIGTGLGFGLVINGELFLGSNGMAMEYGLSPFKWGVCEENVSIRYIRRRAKELYGKEISPVIIEKNFFNNDKKSIKIYNEFGENLGIVLSHVINMINPSVISIGGGLSNAFKCFEKSMHKTIKKYALSNSINDIVIKPSKLKEISTMIGACIYVKNKIN